MGYDPSKKAWVMAYRRLMGYPPYPNSGRAKKYGVPGIMGYQDLWVKGTSTVLLLACSSVAPFDPGGKIRHVSRSRRITFDVHWKQPSQAYLLKPSKSNFDVMSSDL